MADLLGNLIPVPEIEIVGVMPELRHLPWTRRLDYEYQVNPISLKKEQRILRRKGGSLWSISERTAFSSMTPEEQNNLDQLYVFYEAHRSPRQCFYFYDPAEASELHDPLGYSATGRYVCRFADAGLTFDQLRDRMAAGTFSIQEVNVSEETPSCGTAFNTMGDNRRPMFEEAGDMVAPLIRPEIGLADPCDGAHCLCLTPAWPMTQALNSVRVADRRLIFNESFGQSDTALAGLYLPRLISWEVEQEVGASDTATFVIDNLDGVISLYERQVTLEQAVVQFFPFMFGWFFVIKLWAGWVEDHEFDFGAGTLTLRCRGGLSQLNRPFPTRTLSTVCPLEFDDARETWMNQLYGECPYRFAGGGGDPDFCDKSLEGPKGCLSHNMHDWFQGFVVKPQPAFGRFPGFWHRESYTSTSTPLKTVMGLPIPICYGDGRQIVEGLIFEIRDESEFLSASAVVSEGPIGEIGQVLLDGMTQHFGFQPVAMRGGLGPNNIDMKNPTGTRGTQIDFDFRCSGVSWACVRRTDEVGLKNPNEPHDMKIEVLKGIETIFIFRWTGPFLGGGLIYTSNPIDIALDMLLRTMDHRQEPLMGIHWGKFLGNVGGMCYVDYYLDAKIFCDEMVPVLIGGTGTEKRFGFRGTIRDQKPGIDHIRELLLTCCVDLVWYFGALGFRPRRDDITYPPNYQVIFAQNENIVLGSFKADRYKPEFNQLSLVFSDVDADFNQNEVSVYDREHQKRTALRSPFEVDEWRWKPNVLKKQITLNGVFTRSQVLRLGTQLLREELGGKTEAEQLNARIVSMKVPLLGLWIIPGDVSKVIHEELPFGEAYVRWMKWTYSSDNLTILLEGRTVVPSMYEHAAVQLATNASGDPVPGIPGGSQGSDGSENELDELEPPILDLISVNHTTAVVGVTPPPPVVNWLVFQESTEDQFASPVTRILPPLRQVMVGGHVDEEKWVRARWRRSTNPLEESDWSNVLDIHFPKITADEIESLPDPTGLIAPPTPIIRAVFGWDDCIEIDILQYLDLPEGWIDVSVGFAGPFASETGMYGSQTLYIKNDSTIPGVFITHAGAGYSGQSADTECASVGEKTALNGMTTLPSGAFISRSNGNFGSSIINAIGGGKEKILYNSFYDESLVPDDVEPTDPNYWCYAKRAPSEGDPGNNGLPGSDGMSYGWLGVSMGFSYYVQLNADGKDGIGPGEWARIDAGTHRIILPFIQAINRAPFPPMMGGNGVPGPTFQDSGQVSFRLHLPNNGHLDFFGGRASTIGVDWSGQRLRMEGGQQQEYPLDDFFIFVSENPIQVNLGMMETGRWEDALLTHNMPEGVDVQQVGRVSNLFASNIFSFPLDPTKDYHFRVGARRVRNLAQTDFLYSPELSAEVVSKLGDVHVLFPMLGIDGQVPTDSQYGAPIWRERVDSVADLPDDPQYGEIRLVLAPAPALYVYAFGEWRLLSPSGYWRSAFSFARSGPATADTNDSTMYEVPYDCEIESWRILCETAGTPSATQIDINRNGASIFSTCPQLPSGATTVYGTVGFAVTELSKGDILTRDLDFAPAQPPEKLCVQLNVRSRISLT